MMKLPSGMNGLGVLAAGYFLAASLSGCATARKAGWEGATATKQASSTEIAQWMNEGQRLWRERHDRAKLEAALTKFDEVAQADPANYRALIYLARGNYLLGDAHATVVDEKKRFWDAGGRYGERAMATVAAFRKRVADEGAAVEDALETLGRDQIEAIYWSAVNLGKWAKHSGLATQLKYKNRIKKMISRVEALDAAFFFGAVHRYWGTFYAVAPSFAGGDMTKSEQSFQRAFEAAPKVMISRVLYAENYATKKGDRDLFKKTLEQVLAADTRAVPELEPEQILEQRKAKRLLAEMDSLF